VRKTHQIYVIHPLLWALMLPLYAADLTLHEHLRLLDLHLLLHFRHLSLHLHCRRRMLQCFGRLVDLTDCSPQIRATAARQWGAAMQADRSREREVAGENSGSGTYGRGVSCEYRCVDLR
jgi:hypothetical protein